MRRINHKSGRRGRRGDITILFDSVGQLVEHLNGPNPHGDAGGRVASELADRDRAEWAGTPDMPTATRWARSGEWDHPDLSAVQSIVDSVRTRMSADGVTERPAILWNVSGQVPHVGLAMSGAPVHMMTFLPEPTTGHGKVVRIATNIVASSGVSVETMIARGAAMVALVEILSLLGMSVELWVGMGNRAGGHTLNMATCVKAAGEPWDRDRMLFNIANPSNLRRFMFGAMERLPEDERRAFNVGHGYGHCTKFSEGFREEVNPDVYMDAPIEYGHRAEHDPIGWVLETLEGLNLN